MKSLARSPLARNTAITAIFVIIIFLFLYIIKFSGNITGFFRIGDVLPLSPFLNPQDAFIYQGELGYDGQQFLSIAFDPLLQNEGTIATLDHPLYRYRRIFYPLVSYILGLGNARLIPYIMVGINGACIIAIAILCGLYLREDGKMWRSLLVLCVPGCWMVFSLSTSDLLSSLLLISSLYCYKHNRHILTAILLSLACLTRETVLVVWFAVVVVSYWQRNWKQLRNLFLTLIPVFAWNIYVFIRFQDRGTLGTRTNFTYPFFGIFQKIIGFFQNEFTVSTIFEIYLFAVLIACFVLILFYSYQNLEKNRLILGIALTYGLLFCFSSIIILGYYLDFSRVYMDVYFLLLLTGGEGAIAIAPLAASGLASLAFLIVQS
ncbi:MAG: hypothetical protein AAGA60_00195 [Cyanobacteria bacterium P01_E01_bin.42]